MAFRLLAEAAAREVDLAWLPPPPPPAPGFIAVKSCSCVGCCQRTCTALVGQPLFGTPFLVAVAFDLVLLGKEAALNAVGVYF